MHKFHGIGRIFKCKQCPELDTMDSKEVYNLHRKTHKMTLLCHLCNKSFVRNYHLKRHLATHKTMQVKQKQQNRKKVDSHTNQENFSDVCDSSCNQMKDIIKTVFVTKTEEEADVFAIDTCDIEKEDTNPLMFSVDELEIKIEIGEEEIQAQQFNGVKDHKHLTLKEEEYIEFSKLVVKQEPLETHPDGIAEVLPIITECDSHKEIVPFKLKIKKNYLASNPSLMGKKLTKTYKQESETAMENKYKSKINLVCPICNKVVTRLAEHQKRMHNKQLDFKCERCGKAFPFNYELERHHKRHINCGLIPSSKLFQCGLCKGKYSSRKSLVHHVKALHNKMRIDNPTSITEPKCSDDVSQELSKEKHICQYCASTFDTLDLLSSHLLKHHSSSNLACEFCDKTFILFAKLETHRMIHHYEVKYLPCSVLCCNFKCATRAEMKEHTLKIHDKECKFDCFACDLTFVHSATLRQHRIDHHDLEAESPIDAKVNGLTCNQCNKVFASKDTLRLHISSIHKKNECFKCLICLEGFRTTGNCYLYTNSLILLTYF